MDPLYRPVPVKRADVLWGWYEQSLEIAAGRDIVVVEGYLDQVRLRGHGLCAVAKLGKHLTAEQLELLASVPNTKVMWGDNDLDGLQCGSEDVIRLMGRTSVRAVTKFWGLKDAGDTPRLLAREAVGAAVEPAEFLQRLPHLLVAATAKKATKP